MGFDEKAAEYRAKENELSDLRQKESKAQQQIQALELEKSNLIKNKTESQETTKKNDEALAKLRKEITDEKNKCDRIRKIAKKYKESDTEKATKIKEPEAGGAGASKQSTSIEIQTDPTANVASEKQEVEMMKKMLQNQISKLKDDFSKKDTEL